MARVLCAMSGGVDSSVAAYLLKQAGHEVLGAFLRLGSDATAAQSVSSRACCSVEDSRDAALVASRLDIPFYSMNYRGEFSRIIEDFVDEYNRGRTPNPCVRCNQWLKFGSLRHKAAALGCDAVATGHYARIECRDGRYTLRRGLDKQKDQSYFLFLVPASSLPRTLFPVGGFTKDEIRALARSASLPVAEKPDSQEICFVPDDDYRQVLQARSPEKIHPGDLVDRDGRHLGRHTGHQNFTVGQRRGVGVALGSPHYVVDIDAARNVVTLGPREALAKQSARLHEVQWTSIEAPPPGDSLRAAVQIRHRHRPRIATIQVEEGARARLRFDEPQEAIAPGQAAVFYDGDVVLGGGWID